MGTETAVHKSSHCKDRDRRKEIVHFINLQFTPSGRSDSEGTPWFSTEPGHAASAHDRSLMNTVAGVPNARIPAKNIQNLYYNLSIRHYKLDFSHKYGR